MRKTRHASGKKCRQQKAPVSYPNLTRNTRFVPARILFPKGEEHEDGQNWIEQFRVRFALQAQLFQGQRKGQAQRALDNIRPKANDGLFLVPLVDHPEETLLYKCANEGYIKK